MNGWEIVALIVLLPLALLCLVDDYDSARGGA